MYSSQPPVAPRRSGPGRPTTREAAMVRAQEERDAQDLALGQETRRRGPENRGRGRAPMTPAQRARGQADRTEQRTRSEYRENESSTGFSEMGRASRDLNKALGLDRTVGIVGPDANGALGPIWNQIDDVKDEQLQLLKSVYGVSSREQLVIKLQEQAGLREKIVHPLMKYRQASFIHNLTENHYPCDWARYVFPAVGNVKSTI